ncbi:MAG: arylsulfatase [Opitutaceae bacterium]
MAILLTGLFFAWAASINGAPAEPGTATTKAPNVVVILIDDSGFSDASAFGGTVQTPAFDRLAAQGLRYNNFHTVGICTATRASLLSGLNHHRAGFGTLADTAGTSPGYDNRWRDNVPSVAKVLHRGGYSTAAFGKWHNTPWEEISPVGPFDRWPTGLGFDHFYGFMQPGAASQWEPHSMYLGTTPIEPQARPDAAYHMTTDLVDAAIQWIDTVASTAPGKPYFLYFAPGAVHFPHHAPKGYIDRYHGQFDGGWDEYRNQVFARQKRLGIIPPDTDLTPRPSGIPAWETLSPEKKRFFAHEMEVYAGFVEHTDHEIGRFLDSVRGRQGGENTLIFYIFGDNGGSAGAGVGEQAGAKLHQMNEMGGPLHINGIETGWAWAVGAPFQGMKGLASHFGAVRNPLVVSWPARIKNRGGLRSRFAHVNDVAATVYECAGIAFPDRIDGHKTIPLDGVSFASTFDRADTTAPPRTQYFEMFGNRSIYHNGWVAAARNAGGDRPIHWELYHVARDFSQAHDLAAKHPEKLTELKLLFESEARCNHVHPLGERGPQKRTGIGYGPDIKPETAVFHAGLPRLLGIAAPNFTRSHTTTAAVFLSDQHASGVILSWGSRWGGFALYVKDNRLVFESQVPDLGSTTLVSPTVLPTGPLELGYNYEANATGKGDWSWNKHSEGAVQLLVNGKVVAESRAVLDEIAAFWGSFGVGRAFGSPISPNIKPPFPFTGALERVTVRLR